MRTRFWRSLWDASPASRRFAHPSASQPRHVGTGDRVPRVSIIVPVYNSARELRECLSALAASAGELTELIVVDDASPDDSVAVAEEMGATVYRLAKNSGPSAARNHGARHARGDLLFFVDADLVVMPGAVERVIALFDGDPTLSAVFGSYDSRPRVKGIVSEYRNLLHHYVHQRGNAEASTFWGACGAIRRRVFLEIGGFDEKDFPRCIEDIELGYRLRRAGHRIRLDKDLQGTHLKRWTLPSLIRTDVRCRACPWTRLILERGAPDDLNLKSGQRASVALVALAVLGLLLAPFHLAFLGASAVAILIVIVLNRDLYSLFLRYGGLRFAAASVALHMLYYLYGGLTYVYVWCQFHLTKLAVRAGLL
jgi:glycosyltransferase involved in cell wall biosynthesis